MEESQSRVGDPQVRRAIEVPGDSGGREGRVYNYIISFFEEYNTVHVVEGILRVGSRILAQAIPVLSSHAQVYDGSCTHSERPVSRYKLHARDGPSSAPSSMSSDCPAAANPKLQERAMRRVVLNRMCLVPRMAGSTVHRREMSRPRNPRPLLHP